MLSYKYQFWDGAVIVIGLGSSLILNAIFFARKINDDSALTLPDVYAKRYGKVVEIMVSICTIISFICLLAGNLVGMGTIISYYMKITMQGAVGVRLDHVFLAIKLFNAHIIYAPDSFPRL
jgi:Na+/proline symporter